MIPVYVRHENEEVFEEMAERLLQTLYGRMMFRSAEVYSEGWAIEKIKLALQEAAELALRSSYNDTDVVARRCAWCLGTGHRDDGPCQVCRGRGSVLVAQPARKCAKCLGTGHFEDERCTVCGGSGWAFSFVIQYQREK